MDNHDVIKSFFANLLKDLEMKPLSDLQLISVDNKEGRGTSAVQMITTSSITFHSDDKYYCAFIDIFSCKSYDPHSVIELVKKYFAPQKIKTKFLNRSED